MFEIAKKLNNWELVISCELSNPEAETIEIKKDNPGVYRAQKIEALSRWKKQKGQFATYRSLAAILRNDDVDLAEEVEEMALKGKNEWLPCSGIASLKVMRG